MQVDHDSFNPKHAHADPCVNMDAHSNPRRSLKSAQEQEDWRWRRNERDRAWESGGRGSVTCLSLLVKDKLPHSREVPVNVKEWQLKPPRREGERKKITVDEHQQARKLGSWNPLRERIQQMRTNQQKVWQLKPLKREKEDYSGWAPTSTKGWWLKSI